MNDEERRKALGDFLKTRRARLSPSSVGLPEKGASRRTPGLRREEVAQLADVSVTWYTWLEQGRDIKVSEQVLGSIATTLGLSLDERDYLFRLAQKWVPPGPASTKDAVDPALQTVLGNLRTSPAWVMDLHWNILAWNQAACEVLDDFGAMPFKERNLLRLAFTNKTLRWRLVDWETLARRLLAAFRAMVGERTGESWFNQLVEDLKATSPEFREWWPNHDVREPPVGRVVLNHPDAGLLKLDSLSLRVHGNPELSMYIYVAEPETDTAAKIEELISSAIAGCRATY